MNPLPDKVITALESLTKEIRERYNIRTRHQINLGSCFIWAIGASIILEKNGVDFNFVNNADSGHVVLEVDGIKIDSDNFDDEELHDTYNYTDTSHEYWYECSYQHVLEYWTVNGYNYHGLKHENYTWLLEISNALAA